MAFPTDAETPLGVLRVHIDGSWSAESMGRLMSDLSRHHDALGAVYFYAEALAREVQSSTRAYEQESYEERDFSVATLWFGQYVEAYDWRGDIRFREQHPSQNFEALIALSKHFAPALCVRRISYASPGWLDVIGGWNPLKVIADAISEWRRQNTEREKNRLDAEIKREKIRQEAETERLRVRGDVLKTVITSNAPLWQGSGSDRLVEVEQRILQPAQEFIQQLASDTRVGKVALLNAEDDAPPNDASH